MERDAHEETARLRAICTELRCHPSSCALKPTDWRRGERKELLELLESEASSGASERAKRALYPAVAEQHSVQEVPTSLSVHVLLSALGMCIHVLLSALGMCMCFCQHLVCACGAVSTWCVHVLLSALGVCSYGSN